jgi:alpha-N-arabinofuranosidase
MKMIAKMSGATALAGFCVLMALGQTPATLHVDTKQPLHPVSPTLYGLMTEEINHSYDGTVWLQLVTLFPPTYHDRPERETGLT